VALSVGIDVVDVERISKATQSGVPLTDMFTIEEIRVCMSRPRAFSRLAACFAVKEAFLKASGLGLNSGLLFRDIEVSDQGSGALELRLNQRIKELMGDSDTIKCLAASSFTASLACAVVTLERKGTE
jgi:holo-[acyl-carrier protein] synthase